MRTFLKIFPAGHLAISLLFVASGLALIGLAAAQLWDGVRPTEGISLAHRLDAVLGGIAVLTVAVAALELGQTILEEEVQRQSHTGAPTRARRFLSRFMVVLVVALSIEALVLVFRSGHDKPEHLPYAAAVGLTAAALLAAWGVFVRLNRAAEELEPEAMEQAKREDERVRGPE